jgi:dolichol-phosphate mannosyltransferase
MSRPRETDLVIPLYRERESLEELFRELEGLEGPRDLRRSRGAESEGDPPALLEGGRVLFVDDASVDGSGDYVAERIAQGLPFAAELLRHERNQGLSAALCTGARAARGAYVAWLDADLSYGLGTLLRLKAELRDGADLALASPWHPDGEVASVPRHRVVLSRGLSQLYRVLHEPGIHTWSGMVRVWRRELLLRCLPTRPRHLGVTESLLLALAAGAEIREVPARLAWAPGRRSSLRLAPTIRAHLGLLRDALLDRLEPAPPRLESEAGIID